MIADGPDKGMARVRRTMQLAEPVPAALPEDFARLSLDAPSSDEPAPAPVEEDAQTRVAAEHVFVIGDAADAFGAVNAGHNAFFQGEVAARNIVALAGRAEAEAGCVADMDAPALQKYTPGAPAIKVSLGLVSLSLPSLGCDFRRVLTRKRTDEERVPVPGRDRDAGPGAGGPGRAPHLAVLWLPVLARGPRDGPGGAESVYVDS